MTEQKECREAFEAQLQKQFPTVLPSVLLERKNNGDYAGLVTHHAWLAWSAAQAQPAQQPKEIRLCEVPHLFLRPNQPYIFTVDPNCPSCAAANVYEPVIGAQQEQPTCWREGVPGHVHASEWFIAETTDGERVVLIARSENDVFDFRTADHTYYMKSKVKRWMQFPDSEFAAPVDAQQDAERAVFDAQQAQPAQRLSLPDFMVRRIESALNPSGMHLNDGKVRIDGSTLQRLYEIAQQRNDHGIYGVELYCCGNPEPSIDAQQAQPAQKTCANQMREAGKPSPRTCQTCGLGPCSIAQQAHPILQPAAWRKVIEEAPAFNMNAYDDDDVRRLHDWAISLIHLAEQAARPSHAQQAQPADDELTEYLSRCAADPNLSERAKTVADYGGSFIAEVNNAQQAQSAIAQPPAGYVQEQQRNELGYSDEAIDRGDL